MTGLDIDSVPLADSRARTCDVVRGDMRCLPLQGDAGHAATECLSTTVCASSSGGPCAAIVFMSRYAMRMLQTDGRSPPTTSSGAFTRRELMAEAHRVGLIEKLGCSMFDETSMARPDVPRMQLVFSR